MPSEYTYEKGGKIYVPVLEPSLNDPKFKSTVSVAISSLASSAFVWEKPENRRIFVYKICKKKFTNPKNTIAEFVGPA